MRWRPWILGVAVAAVAVAPALLFGCLQRVSDPPTRPASSPSMPRLALPGPGVPPIPLIAPQEAVAFVGSETCASCHPHEAAAHAGSPHSHTLRRAEGQDVVRLFETRQVLIDREMGMRYSFHVREGKPVFRVERLRDGGFEELTPAYMVGSGKRGYTFLMERDGRFMEGRLSFFTAIRRWDWTPGQQGFSPSQAPSGRVQVGESAFSCFICHATTVAREGDRPLPEQSRFDVGCERCHGPGRAHVEAMSAGRAPAGAGAPGDIYRYHAPGQATVMGLCGQCHRSPQSVSSDADLSTIEDLPRFAGTALGASDCYRKSGGRLTCLTCHNPHEPLERSLAHYVSICRSCHTGRTGASPVCPVNRTSGCIGCHMPASAAGFPGGDKFHTHWIKVYQKQPQIP